MKVQSNEYPEESLVSSNELRVRLNIEEKTSEDDTYWLYDEVVTNANVTYSQLLESLIASQYSTGRELAVINNQIDRPEEYIEYQEFRNLCKTIAKRIINDKGLQ